MNLDTSSQAEEVIDHRYNLSSIVNRRNSLMSELSGEYCNRLLVGDVFQTFALKVASKFPSAVKTHIVSQSLMEHLGVKPSRRQLFETFWRLAANIPMLQEDKPVHSWSAQLCKEWAPLEVVSVSSEKRGKKRGYRLTFQVQGGSSVSWRISQFWSSKKVFFLALRRDDRGNGFMFSRPPSSRSRRTPVCIFINPKQLISLQLSGLIDPDLSEDSPNFKEIRFSSGQSIYNREMIKKRERLEEKYNCPFNYRLTVLCHECPVGRDKCPMSCHPKTYVVKDCVSCGKKSYFHNIYKSCCINCEEDCS
jgi:hypothetical protein